MATTKRNPETGLLQPESARPLAGCRKCRRSATTSMVCVRCLSRYKRRKDERVARGLCTVCPNHASDGRKTCGECRARYRRRTNDCNRAVKVRVMAHYGGKCMCPGCGEAAIEFLSIDHINGGGNKHRRELANNRLLPGKNVYQVRGGVNFYRWLERSGFPEGYRVLCFNCNMARGFHGYCPHERQSNVPGQAVQTGT
jgi:hypothetical protein